MASSDDDGPYMAAPKIAPIFRPSKRLIEETTARTYDAVARRMDHLTAPTTRWPWWAVPLLSILAFVVVAFLAWWIVFGLKGILSAMAGSLASMAGLSKPVEVTTTAMVPEGKVLVDR